MIQIKISRKPNGTPQSLGFICPTCGSTHCQVTDTRSTTHGTILRRRYCRKCNRKFTTHESIDGVNTKTKDILVEKLIVIIEQAQSLCDELSAEHEP